MRLKDPPTYSKPYSVSLWIFFFFFSFFFFFYPFIRLPSLTLSTRSHSALMFLFTSQQIIMVGNKHSALLIQATTLPCEYKEKKTPQKKNRNTSYSDVPFQLGNVLACRLRAEWNKERVGLSPTQRIDIGRRLITTPSLSLSALKFWRSMSRSDTRNA